MNFGSFYHLFLLLLLLILVRKPLGHYLSLILNPKEKNFLDPLLGKVERLIYRICHIQPEEESPLQYFYSLLLFSFFSLFATFLILQLQSFFPLNPQHFSPSSADLNFNTAVSFATNTNWQNYNPELSLSYFSQMFGLTVQNFLSPAIGLCALAALTRGIARNNERGVGHFFQDFIRLCLYLFLPLALLFSFFFLSEGVPQNFKPYQEVVSYESKEKQTIVQGPIASQEAIKLLGTNGGGYTNTNSAHPYENPTPLSNFFQIFALLLIPAAQTFYFGKEVKNKKHGWTLFLVMCSLFIGANLLCGHFEHRSSSLFKEVSLSHSAPNMEGKEVRFGIFDSTLFATATTSTSCGATNASHTSFSPIGGLVPLLNMELGEIIFGGVGSGLYGIILFVILSIFLSGLMVGRTPEYLNKRLETGEIKMTMVALLILFTTILGFTALATTAEWGRDALSTKGPHGFSQILYAFSSCAANNGSSFAGASFNTLPYNISFSFAMLIGRYGMMLPIFLLAHYFSKKGMHPTTDSSFPISGRLFFFLLIGVILIIGALTYAPPLVFGPIFEYLEMMRKIFY